MDATSAGFEGPKVPEMLSKSAKEWKRAVSSVQCIAGITAHERHVFLVPKTLLP